MTTVTDEMVERAWNAYNAERAREYEANSGMTTSEGHRKAMRAALEAAAPSPDQHPDIRAQDDFDYRLRGGPGLDYPCMDRDMISCGHSKCQSLKRCRKST